MSGWVSQNLWTVQQQRSPRGERLYKRRVNRRRGGTRLLLLPLLLKLCIVDERVAQHRKETRSTHQAGE